MNRGLVVDVTGENREEAVAQAARALKAGEIVVVPTDTVYGVAADAFQPAATRRIFEVKRRSRRFPLPVLVRSPKQLPGIVSELSEEAERLVAAYWPGPLSLVLPAAEGLSWDIGENEGTVAVRMPLDDIALDVIRAVGPLAVTSANRSGEPATKDAGTARAALGNDIAVYLDDGPRREQRPSTIVDLTRGEPLLIRDGDIPPDEVLAVARGELDPSDVTP